MNKKRAVRTAAGSAAFVCACLVAAPSLAQPGFMPEQPGRGRQPMVCDGIFEIDGTEAPSGGEYKGHLFEGQWVRLFGPIGNRNLMLFTIATNPVGRPPPHEIRPGFYPATILSSGPEPSYLMRVPVFDADEHDPVEEHGYVIVIKTLDRGNPQCPATVEFWGLPHDDEAFGLHPGHANATKGGGG